MSDGSMIYEKNNASGHVDRDRHWWVQAESVIGYFNLWEHFGDKKALEKSLACWKYIKENLIDKDNGEWFWSIYSDGSINRKDDKAGFWKCPYHNGRMCMEIVERLLKTPPSASQKSSL
jgi:mannobiose 2-epimerase